MREYENGLGKSGGPRLGDLQQGGHEWDANRGSYHRTGG